ncbi:unnamed protein product [Lactuca saligna]|uniref:F-box domain-containing protein n=1 Tax=Lactuca saligna TaxID=75948 RepID=A0AA35ZQ43_LACSI|nr:unnamed protein product [Lactuca saligna]
MASPQLPATMEKLPGDVLSNIFIRLLAKQLGQMRCISKSWNALLSQSSFIKSHLHRSIHNNDEILMVFNAEFPSDSEPTAQPKPFIAHPSRSPDIELADFIKLPVIPHSEHKCLFAIGSVHGLICFSYGRYPDSVIYIWNPSLSALLSLPPYSKPSDGDSPWTFLRFGFDPRTDDYKVVKVISLLRPPGNIAPIFANFLSLTSCVVEEWLHVEFSADIIIPYGFTSHGEFLFQIRDVENGSTSQNEFFYDYLYDGPASLLALYDSIASKAKVFKICAANDDTKYVEYVDSLVWVAPIERELSISRLQI